MQLIERVVNGVEVLGSKLSILLFGTTLFYLVVVLPFHAERLYETNPAIVSSDTEAQWYPALQQTNIDDSSFRVYHIGLCLLFIFLIWSVPLFLVVATGLMRRWSRLSIPARRVQLFVILFAGSVFALYLLGSHKVSN